MARKRRNLLQRVEARQRERDKLAELQSHVGEYSKFFPSLKKLPKKKKLTPSQAGKLKRAARELRYTENLHPVTAKQAKILDKHGLLAEVHTTPKKGKKYKKQPKRKVQAIRLRNTPENVKIKVSKDGIIVTSNGRDWEYHQVDKAGDLQANLVALAEELLARDDIAAVHLWTTRGRLGEGFTSVPKFANYLGGRFMQDSIGGESLDTAADWIEGIAALRKKR